MRFSSFSGLRAEIAFLAVGGVLVVGLIYWAGVKTQNEHLRLATATASLRINASELEEKLVELRLKETEFLWRRRETLLEDRDKLVSGVEESLTELRQAASRPEASDLAKQIDQITTDLSTYRENFQKVLAAERTRGVDENRGLQGTMRQAVHQVERRLADLDQPRLSILMLMMRRHEKDFMLRWDTKYLAEHKARLSEFNRSLAATDISDSAKAEIDQLIGADGRIFAD